MQILVTGASGQLGRAVVAEALRRGSRALGLGHAECPVDDAARVAEAIAAARPDYVVHCAAWTDVDGCEADPERADRINGQGTANVVAACRQLGCALAYVSTDYVFDGLGTRPYRVDDPVGPRSAYGRSKRRGEEAVLAAVPGARFWIVRTSWVFGPGGKHFPGAIAARARAGGPLRVVDDQRGCPTYTPDLAAALLDLPHCDAAPGIWHACNEGAVTWHGFAEAIVSKLGLTLPVARISTAELGRPAPRPAYSVLDCSTLTRLRGRPLPAWDDALSRYLKEGGL